MNSKTLILNFKPASMAFKRRLAHQARMQAKRDRSPSRVLVARALVSWQGARGYGDGAANVTPSEWVPGDLTAQVNWAKTWLKSQQVA